jgi:hypothetical protein
MAKKVAKKPANKSTKARAKKSPAGHKRTSRAKPRRKKSAASFFDAFLKIFAQPATRKT